MKFNPINSIFKEGNITLIVKESEDFGVSCKGCWYNGWNSLTGKKKRNFPYGCYSHGHVCTPYYRKDKKYVIFEKVNDIQKV